MPVLSIGKVVHPVGILTGTVGEFDLDKRNLIILVLSSFSLSVIDLVSVCMPSNSDYWQDQVNLANAMIAQGYILALYHCHKPWQMLCMNNL